MVAVSAGCDCQLVGELQLAGKVDGVGQGLHRLAMVVDQGDVVAGNFLCVEGGRVAPVEPGDGPFRAHATQRVKQAALELKSATAGADSIAPGDVMQVHGCGQGAVAIKNNCLICA